MTFPLLHLSTIPGPASGSQVANAISNSANSSYSFTSQSMGAADTTRKIAVAVTWYNGQAVTSVSVGGIGATKVSDPGTIAMSTSGVSWWIVDYPTGTAATIVVGFSGSVTRCGVGVFRVVGASSITPEKTDIVTGMGNPLSASLNVSSGSVVLGAVSMQNSSAAGSYTWSGLTEQYDQLVGGATKQSGAILEVDSPTAGLTISTTYTQTPNTDGMLNIVVMSPW